MVKTSREDRERLASAQELHITLPWPKGVKTLKGLQSAMMRRYHMSFGEVGDVDMSEEEYERAIARGEPVGEDLFYNDDLRSHMGFDQSGFSDPLDLVVFPHFYAGGTNYKGEWEYDEGFGEDYFKKLLTDATDIGVVRRSGEGPKAFRPSLPGGPSEGYLTPGRDPTMPGGGPPVYHGPEERYGGRRPVKVKSYLRRRYYIKERDVRPAHRVWVGSEKWPSQVGMSRLRRHRKRLHPRAFRASIRKGVATRRMRRGRA